jgi:hypothetical protein
VAVWGGGSVSVALRQCWDLGCHLWAKWCCACGAKQAVLCLCNMQLLALEWRLQGDEANSEP